jgi:hypothetical protein
MRWIRRVFQKSRAETDLDGELYFHLDRQVASYVAVGISPEEARRRARLGFRNDPHLALLTEIPSYQELMLGSASIGKL